MSILLKAKYLRKYRKGNKWVYIYRQAKNKSQKKDEDVSASSSVNEAANTISDYGDVNAFFLLDLINNKNNIAKKVKDYFGTSDKKMINAIKTLIDNKAITIAYDNEKPSKEYKYHLGFGEDESGDRYRTFNVYSKVPVDVYVPKHIDDEDKY